MNNFIERLKERPEHHRRRYTFALSAFFSAFIFIIWVSVILPSDVKHVAMEKTTTPKAETPAAVLKSSVASVYDAAKSLFSNTEKKKIDLETEYEKIKSQVESGQVKIIPESER